MGGMPAVRDPSPGHRPGDAALDRVELCGRAVWVMLTLDQQHRRCDARKGRLDRPLPELRLKPGVVPSEERFIDPIAVVPGEPFAQPAGTEGIARGADARDAHVFAEHMRRDQHERADARRRLTRVHDRDRRPVTVSGEHRVVDSGRVEHRAGDFASFDVHVVDAPRELGGVRAAIARAGIGEHAKPRAPVELGGKVTPHRNAAEPLVQENEGRARAVSPAPPPAFEPNATGRDRLHPGRHGVIAGSGWRFRATGPAMWWRHQHQQHPGIVPVACPETPMISLTFAAVFAAGHKHWKRWTPASLGALSCLNMSATMPSLKEPK